MTARWHRVTAAVLAALVCAGCGSAGAGRATARNLLLAAAVVSAGVAVGAAVASENTEKKLRDDLAGGQLTGPQFTDRDDEGRRWNRISRASVFVAGLSLLGLGIWWQAGKAERWESPSVAGATPLVGGAVFTPPSPVGVAAR